MMGVVDASSCGPTPWQSPVESQHARTRQSATNSAKDVNLLEVAANIITDQSQRSATQRSGLTAEHGRGKGEHSLKPAVLESTEHHSSAVSCVGGPPSEPSSAFDVGSSSRGESADAQRRSGTSLTNSSPSSTISSNHHHHPGDSVSLSSDQTEEHRSSGGSDKASLEGFPVQGSGATQLTLSDDTSRQRHDKLVHYFQTLVSAAGKHELYGFGAGRESSVGLSSTYADGLWDPSNANIAESRDRKLETLPGSGRRIRPSNYSAQYRNRDSLLANLSSTTQSNELFMPFQDPRSVVSAYVDQRCSSTSSYGIYRLSSASCPTDNYSARAGATWRTGPHRRKKAVHIPDYSHAVDRYSKQYSFGWYPEPRPAQWTFNQPSYRWDWGARAKTSASAAARPQTERPVPPVTPQTAWHRDFDEVMQPCRGDPSRPTTAGCGGSSAECGDSSRPGSGASAEQLRRLREQVCLGCSRAFPEINYFDIYYHINMVFKWFNWRLDN